MKSHPIPHEALDDRIGIVGTAGSGKTYLAKGCVEELLALKRRVVIVDPLDVWWGLRLAESGKRKAWPIAILGGRHGDIPLTETSGAVIGEAVAKSTESCIVSLAGIKTSAGRRRFMAAFLDAIYEKTTADRDPYHFIHDEADLSAPQKPMGDEAMLCHLMEEIVRRGRVKGFIPWLITQRPAVLNKNVLSQVDGLVAMKLTSSQDRDALEGWIEGQADRNEWKIMRAQLPTLERGQGVLWLPGRGICKVAKFPKNDTFDSSRTPKRGETMQATTLAPLDLPALKAKLVAVEEEVKASDPKALRARVAELERALASSDATPRLVTPDLESLRQAEQNGYQRGWSEGVLAGRKIGSEILQLFNDATDRTRNALVDILNSRDGLPIAPSLPAPANTIPARVAKPGAAPAPIQPARKPSPVASGDGSLSAPQLTMLRALAWWKAMGHPNPTRVQVAVLCGWKVTSGHVKNIAGSLRSAGLVEYPQPSTMTLTVTGAAAAPKPDTAVTLEDSVRSILTTPQLAVFEQLPPRGGPISREAIAGALGWDATSGHLKNVLGSLRSLEIADYPAKGLVARANWLAR